MMKLSVIIVNYNVEHFLEQALLSVQIATQGIESEIFVVDNNSSDGSIEMLRSKFSHIHLIENKENAGFSKANNQALMQACGEYILLLNPDTLVQKDTLKQAISFLENRADAGSVGVKMVNGKGEFLPESKRSLPVPIVAFYKIFGLSKLFPNSKKFGLYHLTHLDNEETNAVDVLSGAFMMIKKEVLDKIGYLDETFFMYGEDIDLCYRITKAGYKNYYFPETKIIHYKGESTKKGSLNYVLVFYRAMQIFSKIHFSKKNAFWFDFLINLAIWIRASVAIFKRILLAVSLPLLDFMLIFCGMFVLTRYWEVTVLLPRSSSFPYYYFYCIIPLYIVCWLIAIVACKGYKKPFSLQKTNKGIILGTIAILLIYALLPETVRFSRAVIVFGAMWTAIAMNSFRYILHKLNIKQFYFGDTSQRKILIIGTLTEALRVADIAQMVDKKPQFIGIKTIQSGEKDELTFHHFNQSVQKITKDQKINELVFCLKDVEIEWMINIIISLKQKNIDFKTIIENGTVLLGSQNIKSPTAISVYE